MLPSLSFSGTDRSRSNSSRSRSSTPIQRIWRYLSNTELSGYRSERALPITEVGDDGHKLGLGNPNILRHILFHIEPKELLIIRRVSCRWNHISCEILRRKLAPVCIRPSKMKQFLRLLKRTFCNPFGSYAIRIDNLSELYIKNFFKRCSLDIIKLRVKISSDEIPDFFNQFLQSLKNLEQLHLIRVPEGMLYLRTDYVPPSAWVYGVFHFPKLSNIIFESDEPTLAFHRNYDAILTQVVNSAPNLVKITFVGWDSHFSRMISRCGISNPKSFDGWKFASSNPKLKEDLLELFYDQRMKFKALKFWINDNNTDDENKKIRSSLSFELVMDLTLQTGENIYHLGLRNDDPSQPFQCSLKLRRLLTFNLQGWSGPVQFLGFDHQFPNLQTLKLNPSNFSDIHITDNKKLPELRNVETLTVMPLDGVKYNPVNETLMDLLVSMCPCVKELFVQVEGDKPLFVVYRNWNRLTKLWVDIRGEGSDEAFTGISSKVMRVVGHWDCGCSKFEFPDDAKKPTHIGNLKDLTHLIIRAGCLSDATLYEGISHLEQLQTLWLLPAFHVEQKQLQSESNTVDIDNEEMSTEIVRFHQMPNPWCLKAIADGFKHLKHLVTSRDVIYSEDDVKYLREKLPQLVHDFEI